MSYLEQKLRLFCSDALDFISPIIFLHPSFRHPVLHVCYCDHTLTNISGKNNISPFNAATRPPATISPPLLTPSSTHLGQSILHAITRWHGWRCPGNCCNTSVAWSLRTNKRRGPARLLHHREPGGIKGLRECRGGGRSHTGCCSPPTFSFNDIILTSLCPECCNRNVRLVHRLIKKMFDSQRN